MEQCIIENHISDKNNIKLLKSYFEGKTLDFFNIYGKKKSQNINEIILLNKETSMSLHHFKKQNVVKYTLLLLVLHCN